MCSSDLANDILRRFISSDVGPSCQLSLSCPICQVGSIRIHVRRLYIFFGDGPKSFEINGLKLHSGEGGTNTHYSKALLTGGGPSGMYMAELL